MTYRHIEVPNVSPAVVSPGSAPQLQWIDIALLVVDDSYQRDLKRQNWRAIRAIAEKFRWSMFSPVFVAPVEGGLFAIIDGQHRSHAAAICGFKQVPCQIVQMTSTEQAAAFAAVNGVVTQVTAGQIYKAAVVASEAWALRLRDVAVSAGCRVMTSPGSSLTKKPGEIYAVVSFRTIVEKHGDIVTTALRQLLAAECWKDDPEYWDNNILFPVMRALCQRQTALNDPDFLSGFNEWDLWAEIDRTKEEAKQRRRGGQPVIPARDLFEYALLEFLDKRFPVHMALPGPISGLETSPAPSPSTAPVKSIVSTAPIARPSPPPVAAAKAPSRPAQPKLGKADMMARIGQIK